MSKAKTEKPVCVKPWHCPRCGADCSGLTNNTKDQGEAVGYYITCHCGCEFIHWENVTYEPYGVEVDGETYVYSGKEGDLRLTIPTYNDQQEEPCDYSRPNLVTLRQETGLRVILGDPDDGNAPDLLIERTPDRWRIIVHPDSSDPMCVIEFTEKTATVTPDTSDTPVLTQSRGSQERV